MNIEQIEMAIKIKQYVSLVIALYILLSAAAYADFYSDSCARTQYAFWETYICQVGQNVAGEHGAKLYKITVHESTNNGLLAPASTYAYCSPGYFSCHMQPDGTQVCECK